MHLVQEFIPSGNNGRNSEGTFARLPFGRILVAAGVLFFIPGPADSFELPKRLFSCAMATVLAFGLIRDVSSGRQDSESKVSLAGAAVLVWMVLRTAAACAFWRTALPLVAVAGPLLCFVLAAARPWPAERIRALSGCVFALGIVEALLMVCQRFGLDFPAVAIPDDGYAPNRMIGTIGYHNQAAEFLCVAIGAGWLYRSLQKATDVGGLSPPLFAAATALMSATIVMTANRGAILALGLQAVWAIAAGVKRKGCVRRRGMVPLVFAVIAILALAANLVVFPETWARFRDVLVSPLSVPAVQTRVTMWRAAATLFRGNFLFGGGAGSFAYRYIDLLGQILPAAKEHEDLAGVTWALEAHCDPLQFLAEFGIVGAALFGVFAFFAARANIFHRAENGGRAAFAIFGAVTVCSLFSFSWQTSLAAPVAAVLIGAVFSQGGEGSETASPCAGLLRWFGIGAALVFSGIVFCENFGNMLTASDNFPDNARDSFFLRGRSAAKAASAAFKKGDFATAAALAEEATPDYQSPELLLVYGTSLRALRGPGEALGVFNRLARSGLVYCEALKGLSLCLEELGRTGEARAIEAERFRLFAENFADAEVYRLVALHMVCGDAAEAEHLSRLFFDRAKLKGEHSKISAEWDNIRGSALLSVGRTTEAADCFRNALRKKPGLQSARRNLEAIEKRPDASRR